MVGWHHRLSEHECEQSPGVQDRGAWCATVCGSQRVEQDLVTERPIGAEPLDQRWPLHEFYRKSQCYL